MSTTERPEKVAQPTQAAAALVPLLVAVVGAVAGTMITQAFADSPNAHLLGAVLGAAIPPFVAVAGPFTGLRAAAGIAVTVVALVITYGGFTVVDAATNAEQPTLPRIIPQPGAQTATTPPSTSPSPADDVAQSACEDGGTLCWHETPKISRCTAGSCDTVTMTNSGTKDLEIRNIEVDGAGAGSVQPDMAACAQTTLAAGQSCAIPIKVTAAMAGDARLVVHQNLQGAPTFVTLRAPAGPTGTPSSPTDSPTTDPNGPDLTGSTSVQCSIVPGGALGGGDGLTLFVPVRNSGPGSLDQLVPYHVSDGTGLTAGGSAAVPDAGSTPMQVTLRPEDYGRTHTFTVTLDPQNAITESNESNNTLTVTVSLPARPAQTQDVPCVAG